MSDKVKSLQEPQKDPLSEGAARFDRLIESVRVKAVQTVGTAPPQTNPLALSNPEEDWARRYRSLSIGPELRGIATQDLPGFPLKAVLPDVPMAEPRTDTPFRAAPQAVDGIGPRPAQSVVPERMVDAKPRSAPSIGAAIGKRGRRGASLLGWLGLR
jgi:hypothetical protein